MELREDHGLTPRLAIRLLGRTEVAVDGRAVRLSGRHAQALVALLVLSRRPRSREAIATDLWPDCAAGASASLRQALWLVRTALTSSGTDPGVILDADAETLGLRAELLIDLDVEHFEALLRAAPPMTREALALYDGDLVEGLGHECFAAERERLSDLYEDALALDAQERLVIRDVEGARHAAELLLARDPLREEAHATLIDVYGAIGTRSQVRRQYRRLCQILRQELDEPPLPETEATYRRALARTVERSALRVTETLFAQRPGSVAQISN